MTYLLKENFLVILKIILIPFKNNCISFFINLKSILRTNKFLWNIPLMTNAGYTKQESELIEFMVKSL